MMRWRGSFVCRTAATAGASYSWTFALLTDVADVSSPVRLLWSCASSASLEFAMMSVFVGG
jgi:hypothetical protein